jgi:hypothetical protein
MRLEQTHGGPFLMLLEYGRGWQSASAFRANQTRLNNINLSKNIRKTLGTLGLDGQWYQVR